MIEARQKPHAIVVGLDDIRGVHAARTLAHQHIPVIGIARDRRSYGCKTWACQRVIQADPRTEQCIEALEELGKTLNNDAVLVPCTDMSVLTLSKHRDRLRDRFLFNFPDHDVLEKLSNKVRFYDFADRVGLPIPKTRKLNSDEDVESAIATLRFPLAVKPPNSKDPEWLEHTHIKAFRANDANELRLIFHQYRHIITPLIVQEWIEGPESNLYACHCYISSEGEVLASFTSRKIRQWPPQTGQACLAEECQNERVREITFELFKKFNFVGLGYVEVKLDQRSGEYLIVEPNVGRVSGRMAIAEAGGVELLHTMYCETLGLSLPEERQQQYRNAKWIFMRQDLQATFSAFRNRQISLRDWYHSLGGPKRYALFSLRDPLPFVSELTSGISLMMRKSERLKRS